MTELLDRFSGIEPFVAAARCGGFTAAAQELDMTPSGVAKAITRLELRTRLKLFHRTTRRVTLTPEGEAYLATCLQVIEELDAAESGLAPKDREPQGRVRIELPAAFGRRHVLPALLNMAKHFPKLDLSISFSERTIDLVQEGFDLAVRIGRLGPDQNLVAHRLGTQRLVICASPDYIEKYGAVLTPDDLTERDSIAGPRRPQRTLWILKSPDGRLRNIEITPRHEFSDGEAMLAAGVAGCGIMQMPTWLVAEDLKRGSLVQMLEDCAGGEMPIHAVWPTSRYVQPKVRAVVECLAKIAAEEGSGFTL
jgi:DNA-binding transcriptional LysR family regulator